MRVDRLSIEYASTAEHITRAGELNHIRRSTGKPLLLIHGLARSWRSENPILNELAAERGVGELGHEYEESPCNAPSVNQPIFLKTAIKKGSSVLSILKSYEDSDQLS
jgi:hypothetical protein